MPTQGLTERVRGVLDSLPGGVMLVAAAKTRTSDEVRAAVAAGVTAIGHNYVQEAESMRAELAAGESGLTTRPQWRLIGHLQRNKARRAAKVFDAVETIDSMRIAEALNRHCADLGKVMPVLVEINSGREAAKTGVAPDDAEALLGEIAALSNVRVEGLMTMGPASGDPEQARPFFRLTKRLFDELAAKGLPNVAMRHLSMGMSNSYLVAIEEGANVVRLGTKLFGPSA